MIQRASFQAGALVVLAGLLLSRWLWGAGLVDDAYIYFRYAENLAAGRGLVFNPFDRVEGFTSPLWMALLAATRALGIDLVRAAPWLSAGCAGAAALGFHRVALRTLPQEHRLIACAPAWLVVTHPAFGFWAWSGLETAAFGGFLLLAVTSLASALVRDAGWWRAGLALLGAVATRPDGAALVPVLAASAWLLHRGRLGQRLWAVVRLCVPLAALGALLLARHWYYDAWLPNTYFAKVGVPRPALLANGFLYAAGFAKAFAPLLLLNAAFLRICRRAGRPVPIDVALALAVCGTWVLLVVWVGGDHFGLFRFHAPLVPLLGLGAIHLLAWCLDRWPVSGRFLRFQVANALLHLVIATHALTYLTSTGFQARIEVAVAKTWADVGLWLHERFPPHTRMAAVAVGAMPYYSRFVTYDMVGLTNRHIAREGSVYPQARPGHYKYDTQYVLERLPDIVVYSSSGLFFEPHTPEEAQLDIGFEFALHAFSTDERVADLYRFRAERLPSGRYVHYLERREPAIVATGSGAP